MRNLLAWKLIRGWGRMKGRSERLKLVARPNGTFVIGRTFTGTVNPAGFAWDHLPILWADRNESPPFVPHSELYVPWEHAPQGGATPVTSEKEARLMFNGIVYTADSDMRYNSRCHCVQCEYGGGDCMYAEPEELTAL